MLLEKCSREIDQGNFNSFSRNFVINSIVEFRYRPEEEVTFAAYFRRYEEFFFKKNVSNGQTREKVRLLLNKFGAIEYESMLITYY